MSVTQEQFECVTKAKKCFVATVHFCKEVQFLVYTLLLHCYTAGELDILDDGYRFGIWYITMYFMKYYA